MKLHNIIIFCTLLLTFAGCDLIGDDYVDEWPFICSFNVKYVQPDGINLLGKYSEEELKNIQVRFLEPQNGYNLNVMNTYYSSIGELHVVFREAPEVFRMKEGDFQRNYALEIQLPEALQSRKDTVELGFLFHNYGQSLTDVFLNGQKIAIPSNQYNFTLDVIV